MSTFFAFEADFVDSLRCIPMQVRLKLDTCGIKLKLAQWHQFSQRDRQYLVDQPCDTPDEITAYRTALQHMVFDRTGAIATDLPIDPTPPWQDTATIPDSVQTKAAEVATPLTPTQWATLSPVQRFALIKLSRSGHENNNFLPALKEFQLV